MNPNSIYIAINAVAALTIVGVIVRTSLANKKIQNADKQAERMIENAKREVNNIITRAEREAQSNTSKARRIAEEEIKLRRQSVVEIENRVIQKEKQLDQKEAQIEEKEQHLEAEHEKMRGARKKLDATLNEMVEKVEVISKMSKEEAQKLLMESIEKTTKKQMGKMIKEMEEQAKKIANRRAKEIVVDAIQRTAVDHVPAATTTIIQLPDDDMKGRVIGKEGRNIRAFEAQTGVDIIIDDTPGTIIVSAFDPIRREVAKMALTKLLEDGRIHPTRVEEAVEKAKKELYEIIIQRGEKAVEELGLQFHPKIIEYIGKLYYRTSYGQNMLYHSMESAHIAGLMASELGVNVNLSKRGALLHDIGKAIDFESEGTHTDLGKEICEKYGESAEVINCIMAHHEDEEPDTIEAVLVMMADAISSVRPGARREATESYIKRLEKLEALAYSYEGVEKAYAVQAGREIRVIVQPEVIDDDEATKLAFDMARKIENEMDYPGEIKVNVVRETRAYSIAQ